MKELPHSIEAEQALLGSMIIDSNIITGLTLKDTDFYETTHKVLFKAIKSVLKKHNTVDMLLLSGYLKEKSLLQQCGGNAYIVEMTSTVPTSANSKSYENTIKAHSTSRKLIYQCDKIQRACYEGDNEKAGKEVHVLTDNIEIDIKKGYDAEDLTNKAFDFIDMYNQSGGLGSPSPHPELDKLVPMYMPGKVTTVVAYSCVGKSNFTYPYIIEALKQGKRVIFFSLEVSADMLTVNLLKCHYEKSFQEIREEAFFNEYNPEIIKNLTVYDDVEDLDDICDICEQEEPDVICVDFIQNVETKASNEVEKLDKIARGFQKLAIKTNISVLNISQANNASERVPADQVVARGSGKIYHSTDIMLSLAKGGNTGLEVCVRKNKFGPTGSTFDVNADFSKLQFKVVKRLGEESEAISDFTARKIDF